MTRKEERVGIWVEKEQRTLHKSFEYAGAGEIHHSKPGTCEVTTNGRWFFARIPTTRVDSWFQNRIGACYGSDNRDTRPVDSDYCVQMDAYNVAKAVKRGTIRLNHDWEIVHTGSFYSIPWKCGDPTDPKHDKPDPDNPIIRVERKVAS